MKQDMNAINRALAPHWAALEGARIFITGGTGFIGRWMLEALVFSGVGAEVVVLTRNPDAFAAKAPHLARTLTLMAGDVRDFDRPDGPFTHIIHGATDASAALNANDPCLMFDTITDGTRRVLDMAAAKGVTRVLNMSSGAVYGAQPAHMSHVPERWPGAPYPDDPKSAYGEGKRAAELLCALYRRQYGVDVVTARIFALLGPMLSLDTHFAVGNFIRDAMAGRPIVIHSAGQAVRSYLYIADLAHWLWAMLLRAPAGAVYNLGSEEGISIADLAWRVNAVLKGGGVRIAGRADAGWNPGRYVPSTAKIRRQLGLVPTVGLDDAILRTAIFNGWKA